ncbi:MAG: cell division protein ZipA C-terminal FtsZ-binding domain-containing protein [Burkholderiales bacterium]
MSDLQLGLLAIGVAVVAGVIAYNRWQEARLRRRTEGAFAGRHRDALLGGEGTTVPAPPARAPATEPAQVDRTIEHTIVLDAPSPPPPRDEPATRLSAAGLDPKVDYIVELDCARPVPGADLARHAQALLDEALVRPVHWEGYDEARAAWRSVSPEGRYPRLRVGIQLTNRAGPLGDDDLLAFCGDVQEVALAIAAQADFPDTEAAVALAQDLDRFCAAVDVQIGLSVIGSESHAFPGSKVRSLAESAGMTIGRDGRFHRHAEDGTELFSLSNLEPMPFHIETMKTLQTRGVTALFDVPRVSASPSAFRRFIDFAHQLEQALGGVLVDDNRKPIGQAALEAIGQQLESIHQTMAARGIPAGGPLALRLFS